MAQVVAALRDDLGLHAPRRADAGDAQIRVVPAQAVGEGQQRIDVPAGASAGQHHRSQFSHRQLLLPGAVPPARRAAAWVRGSRGSGGNGAQSSRIHFDGRTGVQRLGGVRFGPGRGAQHPGRGQCDHERAAAVGDERQRQAGDRHDPDHAADVDDRLPDEPDRDAGRDQSPELVVDPAGDAQPGVGEHAEEQQHDQAADDAQLLGDDGEDEVVVRVGHDAPFEVALAEPDAEPATVGQRPQAPQVLVAPGLGGRVDARVEEDLEPVEPVVLAGRQQDQRDDAGQR